MDAHNHSIKFVDILGEVVLGGCFNLNERVHLFEISLKHCSDWTSHVVLFEEEVLLRIFRLHNGA